MNIRVVLFGLLLTGCSMSKDIQEVTIPNKSIYLNDLQAMFENISNQTEWDMDGDMLWGYFFVDEDPSLLKKAKGLLEGKGYRFVDLYLSDKDDINEPDVYWLHVEKVEKHTPASLDKRNNESYVFAHELGLSSYDGMDVGPAQVASSNK